MNLEKLNATAIALTEITSAVWNVKGEDEIVRADGLSLWFREGGYGNRGKIAIRFSRPRGRDNSYPTLWAKSPATGQISDPSINVGDTKTGEQIAKDIVRRLLAESEVVFALATAALKAEADYRVGKADTIKEMADVCNVLPSRDYHTHELTGEVDIYKASGLKPFGIYGYGKVKVSSPDTVDLEIHSMSKAVAKEIVSAITAILKTHSV